MEDDGDDKDDSKRRTRNLSEKKRRDQFNMLVTELSTLITTNNRKMDKSTVLKSTISFLKNHNEITVRSRAHDVQEEWKPAFLSNEEFTYLVLEALEGFVMVFSVCGRIYYVSESITSLLGHNPVDIVNRNIFDLTFEEDRPNLYNLLQRNAIATEQMPNISKENEMIRFQLHLRRGTLDFREESSYDLVQFYGHFRLNQEQVDEDQDRIGYQEDPESRMLFICIGRLHTPQLIRDVSLVDSSRNEFTSRHSLEWKFLFLDHRAPPIIGYLPFEVLGTSGYDYYHFDDLEKVVTCHEALMQKGELTSCYYRFLTKGQQWIWLQTRFYITYHQWNSKPEFVVCTHRVVSFADVVNTTKEEGAEEVDVSEAEAIQNSVKDTLNEADDPMQPMSPSYVSEAASDAYGNSYQAISQSTLSQPQYLESTTLADFAKNMVSQSETPQVPPSNVSLFEISLSDNELTSLPELLQSSEQSPPSLPENTAQTSSSLRTSFSDTAIQAKSQPSAALSSTNSLSLEILQNNAALSQSIALEQAISQSKAAIQALSQSNAALQAISHSSNTAINAMSQSDAAIQAISQSNAAMLAISQSNAAIQAISQYNAAMKAISQSNMQAISQSHSDIQTIMPDDDLMQSNAAIHAISQPNKAKSHAYVQDVSQSQSQALELQLEEEIQAITTSIALQSNALNSQASQPISKPTPEKRTIPTVLITQPSMTSIPRTSLPSVSPSYTAETATDGFGNTFQLVSQNLLATPSPVPLSLSPSHKSERSDCYTNYFQAISQDSLRTPPSEGQSACDNMSECSDSINHCCESYNRKRGTDTLSVRALPASSPTCLSEASDTHGNPFNQSWQPASVKSASAGSTAGTINTAATTWPRNQTHYAAGSDAGSMSGESRSSQLNSERESQKTTETKLTPQHGIGAQYLDPNAYGSIVPAGMMPISPVLVSSDNAQIQEQLQRKHEELQQMIVRQQEELRQVKEQLLLARLGLLQPLINVPNPYSTPEEIQNQQRMSAQLAYTNSPRAIGYPQHVQLPMPTLVPHPQAQHSQLPTLPTQSPHPSHTQHPTHPTHPPHPSEPHQHMPQ